MWRHYPWLIALMVAPLLYGSVTAVGQIAVGGLLALSLVLLSGELGGWHRPVASRWWGLAAVAMLVLPLIPLPVSLVALISPATWTMARDFFPGGPPSWLCLSLSPAGTVQRLWELVLIISCFSLARNAALNPTFPLALARALATALVLVLASDLWFRCRNDGYLLGLWEDKWHYAAGTFANRNHFANWVFLVALFLLGWFLRSLAPLRSARGDKQALPRQSLLQSVIMGLLLCLALILAVATGSRAGSVAFVVGACVWVLLLRLRSHSRRRWLVVGLAIFVAFAFALVASQLLFERLARASTDVPFKLGLWADVWRIAMQFPIFGTGGGTFVTAFSYYKSVGAGLTVWHAENEWLQLFFETGLVGLGICGGLLFLLLRTVCRTALHGRLREPELFFGAVAGLAAFVAHAFTEFVFQIPATAMLAAALFGFLTGAAEQTVRPIALPPPTRRRMLANFGWAGGIGVVTLLQGAGLWYWHQASWQTVAPEQRIQAIRMASHFWPFDTRYSIAWFRSQAVVLNNLPLERQHALVALTRPNARRLLAWDPYNWELRLENAWFELNFSPDENSVVREAWNVVHLNPSQPLIPLHFAEHFAESNPRLARGFLQGVMVRSPEVHRQVLELAWKVEPLPARLWDVTPDQPEALITLGEFALGKDLKQLAAQAFHQAASKMPAELLAKRLLQAGATHEALNVLSSELSSTEARIIWIRAKIQLGEYADAIRQAESIWVESHARTRIFRSFTAGQKEAKGPVADEDSLESLKAARVTAPDNLELAGKLAEKIFTQKAGERDLAELERLVKRFPKEPRLLWMLHQSWLDQHRFAEAAQSALQLAELVAGSK